MSSGARPPREVRRSAGLRKPGDLTQRLRFRCGHSTHLPLPSSGPYRVVAMPARIWKTGDAGRCCAGWAVAAVIALTLAGCGGAASAVCTRWHARALADQASARARGSQFVVQFEGLPGDGPATLASMKAQVARATYRLLITTDRAAPAWRAAAPCSTPGFDP